MKILALTSSGLPKAWLSVQQAMFYQAKDLVLWSIGDPIEVYRGGKNKEGVRSILATPSIIAIKNNSNKHEPVSDRIVLTNNSLFARDQNICCYCTESYPREKLSRDHVIAKHNGGLDIWTNVVTSCKSCNGIKGHKTLKELGWKLAYVPYEPNYYEYWILKNRNILADQMEFLMAKVPKHSRMHSLIKNYS
jgi:hypothetical protein